ncbi:ornithine cyclodeaminase [Roseibium sediminicola]|uniref:Ornithine cyclodeaminase n=1 Tax=Roseibium sediminicola TaxID=2933272 RepID=A0ABT0GVH2_9HYPH|nr:ornithine cyclodeaminase [Roseibium sp. CAU 1639]MCK7613445.1 ornithine cyclodeaminase [Roseibium sp. CAU 1639]
MRIISSDEIDACLDDRSVLETLRRAYRSNTVAPETAPLPIDRLNQLSGALSLQPAWTDFATQGDVSRGYIGCALSLDLPEQSGQAASLYLLFSGATGQPIALMDGMRLTVWRTSALHALAASYLSREDTSRLLVIGDDPRLPRLVSAYADVRNLTSILLAGTSPETRKRIAGLPELKGVHVGVTDEIYAAQEGADMICIAGPESGTGTHHALTYLDPPAGCHIDVIDPSAQLPSELLEEARLFTSDLVAPPRPELEWAADLKEFTQGEKAGRRYYGQRTLFLPGSRTGLADYALAAHIFLRT